MPWRPGSPSCPPMGHRKDAEGSCKPANSGRKITNEPSSRTRGSSRTWGSSRTRRRTHPVRSEPNSDAADLHVGASPAGQDRKVHKSSFSTAPRRSSRRRQRGVMEPMDRTSPTRLRDERLVDPDSCSHDDTDRSRSTPFTQTHRVCFPRMRSLTIRHLAIGILQFLHFEIFNLEQFLREQDERLE